ncbi:MAG: glycosyltransferase family 2 protein, partial [Tateyamaria sp.]|nr:glycosyltransferase family 2 protein [Tateyamaria sp.]
MHFYNEAKMLKWWIPHHTELFDEGILINHSSTDGSVDICRSIAPHWRVIDTELTDFNAIENDLEVMKHEATVDGWKMVLNVTEFLVCKPNRLDLILKDMKSNNISCLQTRGVIMVDSKPDVLASEKKSLVQQKCQGYIEDKHPYHGGKLALLRDLYYHLEIASGKRRSRLGYRNRIIHSHLTGDYGVGRHGTNHNIGSISEPVYTFWYGFSPWDQQMILRKQQIKERIPKEDSKKNMGFHHFWGEARLQEEY